jgi:hypothetical protein
MRKGDTTVNDCNEGGPLPAGKRAEQSMRAHNVKLLALKIEVPRTFGFESCYETVHIASESRELPGSVRFHVHSREKRP